MKTTIITLILGLSISVSASAAATKVCNGLGNARGNSFTLYVTQKKAEIKEAAGQLDWLDGTYKHEKDVDGKDGVNYLQFDLGYNDGANYLLVDEDLLDEGTKGLAKIGNRGEGFNEDRYYCKDKE